MSISILLSNGDGYANVFGMSTSAHYCVCLVHYLEHATQFCPFSALNVRRTTGNLTEYYAKRMPRQKLVRKRSLRQPKHVVTRSN
jgi:hypothetical protein